MNIFSLPSRDYSKLVDQKNIGKFNKVHVNSHFGIRPASIYLKSTPIEGIELYVSDPAYETPLCRYYPIYMGRIVMLGFLISPRSSKHEFIVEPNLTIIRKSVVPNDSYRREFTSKQIVLLSSDNADLFIPSVKYD